MDVLPPPEPWVGAGVLPEPEPSGQFPPELENAESLPSGLAVWGVVEVSRLALTCTMVRIGTM